MGMSKQFSTIYKTRAESQSLIADMLIRETNIANQHLRRSRLYERYHSRGRSRHTLIPTDHGDQQTVIAGL